MKSSTARYIPYALAAGVALLVYSKRVQAAPEKPPVTPPTPSTPEEALAKARKLISDLENNPSIDPVQAATTLDAAALASAAISPQAALELKAAADSFRKRGQNPNPGPTPGTRTVGDQALANDEVYAVPSVTQLQPGIVPVGGSAVIFVKGVSKDELRGPVVAVVSPILGRVALPVNYPDVTIPRSSVTAVYRGGQPLVVPV